MGACLRERGAKVVVIKEGECGCTVFSDGEEFSVPAYSVEVVDTTGAGDCFCGGFLAGLYRGFDLRQAARLANAVAAHGIQKIGGIDGVVDFNATTEWMRTAEGKNR